MFCGEGQPIGHEEEGIVVDVGGLARHNVFAWRLRETWEQLTTCQYTPNSRALDIVRAADIPALRIPMLLMPEFEARQGGRGNLCTCRERFLLESFLLEKWFLH